MGDLHRRRRRWLRATLGALVISVTLLGAVAVYVERTIVAPIDRIDGVFADLPPRPPVMTSGPGAGAVNVLLLGTDRRSAVPTTGDRAQAPAWQVGAQRSDAMLIAHISADRDSVTFVSLPRDSWVAIPGYGSAKINAAYSWGGPRLAVATVEKLTGVRIDHVAVIDWEGVRHLTDALGGVTIEIPATVHDPVRDVTWTAGRHHLDGRGVLDYVAQRYGLLDGDLGRARRQQNVLRVVLGDTLERLADSGPLGVHHLIAVVAENISVDAGWGTGEMVRLAWSLRDIDREGVRFLTVPLAGFGREGAQSIVRIDAVAAHTLWRSMRRDEMSAWLRQHREAELTDRTR